MKFLVKEMYAKILKVESDKTADLLEKWQLKQSVAFLVRSFRKTASTKGLTTLTSKRTFRRRWRKSIGCQGSAATAENFIIDNNWEYFKVLKLAGMFPFIVSEHGVQFKKWTFAYQWTCLTLVTSILLAIYNWYIMYNVFSTMELTEDDYGQSVAITLYPPIAVLNIILFCESKKIARYLNNWQVFHVQLELLTGQRIKSRCIRTWLTLQSLLFFGSSVHYIVLNFESYQHFVGDKGLNQVQLALFLILWPICDFFISVYLLLWYMYTLFIKQAGSLLSNDIQRLSWLSTNSLEKHIILWRQLQQLCVGLGNSFSFSVMYFCGIMYVANLPLLYDVTKAAANGDYSKILFSVNAVFAITILGELSHRATAVVGPMFEGALSDLLSKVEKGVAQQELLKMSRVISTNPPTISLAGFFDLDRGINVPVYSSMMIYFVFILQFSSAPHNPTQLGINATNLQYANESLQN